MIEKRYNGIDWRTALIKTRRLAILRALRVQEERRASRFSKRILQDECFMAESVMGAPIYLEGRTAIENPRMRAMEAWVKAGV